MINKGDFVWATGLKGFRGYTTLRASVIEVLRDGTVHVVTRDLIDAGTSLLLDPSQVELIEG